MDEFKSRLLGLASNGWKLRHFVLYDNHLFWGRGQWLTLVDFSAQPKPFLTQNIPPK